MYHPLVSTEGISSDLILDDCKTTPPIIRKVLDTLEWSPPNVNPNRSYDFEDQSPEDESYLEPWTLSSDNHQSARNRVGLFSRDYLGASSASICSVVCQLEKLRHQLNSLSIDHKLESSLSRWRNIDVSCPILIPRGCLKIIYDDQTLTTTSRYEFEENQLASDIFGSDCPGQNTINTLNEPPMDNLVQSAMLRTRLAVIHKCPDLLVPKISQIFSESVARACPLFDSPIEFVCDRISRCYVANGPNEYQERTEALISPASSEDEQKLVQVSAILNEFASIINLEIKPVLAGFYQCLPKETKKNIPGDLFKKPGTAAIEFRFAPSKQMKVPLACRRVSKPKSLCQRRVDIKGLEVSELRLEMDRRCEKEWDPLFLELNATYVPTKKIVCDDAGWPSGRATLVPKSNIRLPRIM